MMTSRFLLFFVAFAILSACSSVPSSPKDQAIQAERVAALKPISDYAFNRALLTDLNNSDVNRLRDKIDVLLIAQQLREIDPQLYSSPFSTAKTAADIKNQIVSGLIDVSSSYTWQYLYSEQISAQKTAAYYRISSGNGYNYIAFWMMPDSHQIYDFKSASFSLSALNFVSQFTQLFKQFPDDQLAMKDLIAAAQKNDINTLLNSYRSLSTEIKSQTALNDFLLRKNGQLAVDQRQSLQAALMTIFEQQNRTSLLFEAKYIEDKDFSSAIKIIQALPYFARNDSKMHSELAILHAYHQQFDKALLYAREAIYAEPNDDEAYFVLLQITFYAKQYALSMAVLNTLVAKFDYIMGQDVIIEFEQSDGFIHSTEYQTWLAQQTK